MLLYLRVGRQVLLLVRALQSMTGTNCHGTKLPATADVGVEATKEHRARDEEEGEQPDRTVDAHVWAHVAVHVAVATSVLWKCMSGEHVPQCPRLDATEARCFQFNLLMHQPSKPPREL